MIRNTITIISELVLNNEPWSLYNIPIKEHPLPELLHSGSEAVWTWSDCLKRQDLLNKDIIWKCNNNGSDAKSDRYFNRKFIESKN